jgi:hypothetical protein
MMSDSSRGAVRLAVHAADAAFPAGGAPNSVLHFSPGNRPIFLAASGFQIGFSIHQQARIYNQKAIDNAHKYKV